jgi:hypothetical protein
LPPADALIVVDPTEIASTVPPAIVAIAGLSVDQLTVVGRILPSTAVTVADTIVKKPDSTVTADSLSETDAMAFGSGLVGPSEPAHEAKRIQPVSAAVTEATDDIFAFTVIFRRSKSCYLLQPVKCGLRYHGRQGQVLYCHNVG